VNFHHQPITLCTWILLIALQLFLAGVLRFGPNQGTRRYPAFRALVYFSALSSPLLFLVSAVGAYALYWWSYWATELVVACLYASLIYELWFELFRPAWAIPRPVIRTFLTAIGAVSASAVLLGVIVPSSYPNLLMVITLTSDRTFSMACTAATILIVCFGSYYGAHWRSRVYGLALGLMFQGVVSSAITIASASMTAQFPDLLYALTPVSSCICFLVWTYYFLPPEQRALAIYDSDVSKILAEHSASGRGLA